jgi:phage shock protein A
MDPFSALSLAAAVFQFIDFGIKLSVKSSEVYRSIDGHDQADLAVLQDTKRLGAFSERLDQSLSYQHSVAEVNIASLARECATEARKLRAILYELQGLTLGEKVRIILDGLDQKTDTEKLDTLRDRIDSRTDKEKLDDILQRLAGASDTKKSLKFSSLSFHRHMRESCHPP